MNIESNGKKKMGRPTSVKRDKRFELRLSAETFLILEECAKKLNTTKADIVHKGIELVKNEIEDK